MDLKGLALLCSSQGFVSYLLNQPWHRYCEIIPDWISPEADKLERQGHHQIREVKVLCPNKNVSKASNGYYSIGEALYLRFSHGPRQGYSWDIVGDDFKEIEWAVIALSKAPAPPNVLEWDRPHG